MGTAQALGKPLDIDRYRTGAPNRIYRIGIELEGGWTKLPTGTRALEHDGSVVIERGIGDPNLQTGELANGPMTMQEWEPWLKSHYPQRVNQTCGMHVHLSPRTALSYSRLMCPEFPGTVVAYISKWAENEGLPKGHAIWPRLKGKSMYCQHLYMADDQIRNVSKDHNRERLGHRYTVINYCHGRHGTIECRLLPMMDTVEQSARLIQELIDITNGFLKTTRKKEARHQIKVEAEGPSNQEYVLEIPRNERRNRTIR